MNKRVGNSEELLFAKEGEQANKLRSLRKSIIGGMSGKEFLSLTSDVLQLVLFV